MPVAWYRTYTGASGKIGRVFTTTHGASEDLLNDGFRRMAVNACLWAAGLEASIQPDSDISFVGPYHPSTFALRRVCQGREAGGSGGLGLADSAESSRRPSVPVLHQSPESASTLPMTTICRRWSRWRSRWRCLQAARHRRCAAQAADAVRAARPAITSASSATRSPSGCNTTAGSRRCCTRGFRSTTW